MAIIILKGADFSADNIGQITLPEEMHEFTKKIFSHCTKYSIYSEQAKLIDDFINYLDTENLLEHLGLFMAPWLSNNLEESTYNVAKETQLESQSGVSFNNGVLVGSTTSRVLIGENIVPAVNFICTIASDTLLAFTGVYTGGTDNSKMTLLTGGNQNITRVSKSVNPNAAYGYKLNVTSYSEKKYNVWNIKGLSNLDTNGSTMNGIALTPNTGYDKTSEPLSAPNGFVSLIPEVNGFGTPIKEIFIAGDGTNLTDAQVTSMIDAVNTLQVGLAALEE